MLVCLQLHETSHGADHAPGKAWSIEVLSSCDTSCKGSSLSRLLAVPSPSLCLLGGLTVCRRIAYSKDWAVLSVCVNCARSFRSPGCSKHVLIGPVPPKGIVEVTYSCLPVEHRKMQPLQHFGRWMVLSLHFQRVSKRLGWYGTKKKTTGASVIRPTVLHVKKSFGFF